MRTSWIGIAVGCCLLTGCGDKALPAASGAKSQGRYAGIGVVDAGRLWQQQVRQESSDDAALARIADDEHIIVVLDSHSGEVRQCGDFSGYCTAMNPWDASKSSGSLPAKLTKHAADLDQESEAEADVESTAK